MKTADTTLPRWRRDFPIAWEEDQLVTRRQLGRFVVFTSVGLLASTLLAALRLGLRRTMPPAAVAIATVGEIPVGGYKLFRYPTADDPAILLRLEESRFVAFSQLCTHLSCPVHLARKRQQLICPCHHGVFAADDGRVIAGPPRRALPKITVQVREGAVWAG
jgi:nitrite reductase/ring-hydroxylating ferredoxin subunit